MVPSVCVADGCPAFSKVIQRETLQPTADWRSIFAYSASQDSPGSSPRQIESEVRTMPVNKEFTIRLEDRPGTLGKVCQALADQNVNILAFQQLPLEKGKGAVRLVLDNPAAAKTTLDQQRADYTETEVAQINLSHRTGELARAASRLGEAGININYGYCGAEPGTNATFVIFGVAEVGKAVKVFEQAAAARPST